MPLFYSGPKETPSELRRPKSYFCSYLCDKNNSSNSENIIRILLYDLLTKRLGLLECAR